MSKTSKPMFVAGKNRHGLWFVDGPPSCMSFNSHDTHPELTCNSEEEAIRAAKIANIAYDRGKEQGAYEVQQRITEVWNINPTK